MSYIETWKVAKKNFESATNRKKPGEKFLLFFNKASGMEKVCKGLDSATKKKVEKDLIKASNEYKKAMHEYMQLLDRAEHNDAHGEEYKTEVVKLGAALQHILQDFNTTYLAHLHKDLAVVEKSAKELAELVEKEFMNVQSLVHESKQTARVIDAHVEEILTAVEKNEFDTGQKLWAKIEEKTSGISSNRSKFARSKDLARKKYFATSETWGELAEQGGSPVQKWKHQVEERLKEIQHLEETLETVWNHVLRAGKKGDDALAAGAKNR